MKTIIILITLIVGVYSFDIYLYFFNEKPIEETITNQEVKKVKENIYITEDFFKGNEPRIKGIGYYQQSIGSLIFYKSTYNDNLIRIIIGEQDELTNLTYQSILSTIKFMYPNEYNDFLTNFPNLKNLGYQRYQITLNPTLDAIESRYLQSYSDYQYVLIEILRTI